MAEKLVGRWQMQSSNNFEEYLKAIGVGFKTRKIASLLKPEQIISLEDDGTWRIVTSSTFRSTDVKFKLNEEVKETTGDGRDVTCMYKTEENKLTKTEDGKPASSVVTREVDGDTMTMTLVTGDVTCTRVYQRVS